MKLDKITDQDIKLAAKQIDQNGIPRNHVWSQYYVEVDGKEYPFKYLIILAFEIAGLPKPDFKSNDAYRNFISSLGFSMTHYDGGYNFFTKEELEYYASIANTDYRKAELNHKFYGQKLFPIMSKAKFWAKELLQDDLKLKDDGKWTTGHTSKVKPYFWPRLYLGEDKDVFINVEVNGQQRFIGYKLDGYNQTKKALSQSNQRLFDEYKNKINLESPKISFDDVNKYTWAKLIAESKAYLTKYLPHLRKLKEVLSKDSKICRIAWNTNNWIKPSGRNGKSVNPSFEFEHGFGHEEWLFDGSKTIDGFKYGFLTPIYKSYKKYEGKVLDLSLFCRDQVSSGYYWVAYLENVEVIGRQEAEQVLNHYKETGWYEEMKRDLTNLSLDPHNLDKWSKDGAEKLFNVKFKADLLEEIPEQLIPIDDQKKIFNSDHYLLLDALTNVHNTILDSTRKPFSFSDSGKNDASLPEKGTRHTQKNEIELEFRHNKIQTEFLNYLQALQDKDSVKIECNVFGGRIDIAQRTKTGFIFYEIKTYNNLKTSIRNGIGQLLEYCFYPESQEAEKIVLVSDVEPTPEQLKYLNHVKTFLNVPFSYINFDPEKRAIISQT